MKRIKKDEMFKNVTRFLKRQGVELTEGTYSGHIQKGCSALTDMINLSRDGIQRATSEIDKHLDHLRQAVHEATAPKPTKKPAGAKRTAKPKGKTSAKSTPKTSPKTKRSKSR